MLDHRVGISITPGLPDTGERVALDAQRIDDHVVDGDIGHAEVVEQRERLPPDVQIAADGRTIDRRNPLPEAVGIELRRVAEEHSVVFGDQVQPLTRP